MTRLRLPALIVCLCTGFVFAQADPVFKDRSPAAIYSASCASCHGANHQGGNASSLADKVWAYGSSDQDIFRNIKQGITTMGMPAYGETFSDEEIRSLVSWLREQEKTARAQPQQRATVEKTRLHTYRIETVAEGLREPWSIAWLPDGRALITEKVGRLRILKDGKLLSEPVRDIPESRPHGQGGLMAVAIDPQYEKEPWIYLGYTHVSPRDPRRFMTRIVRGQLSEDNRWTEQQVIWEAQPEHYYSAGVHFGTRIVFDREGLLYFSIGDRGSMDHAQDLARPNGKHHRIHRDGSIPRSNPFVGRPGVYESIFSYGNRNPQGLAIHPETDQLWSTEHGPMGGDELNLIEAGKNYGWPVITYGINYNGRPISAIQKKEGMEQPVVQWTPSPAMCGLAFYTGERFEKWNGDLLAGALKFEEIKRLRLRDNKVVEEEVILKNHGRVRDVNVGPDGYIYVCLNRPDKVVRLVPAD